ncbi:type II toxin-antitoxin system Phd/YefM family antitoxin [Candidatus Omnitrophota bacterium]
MTITIPLTELRPRLPKIMDRVSKYFDRCIITRHGQPEAVILSIEDYESILETMEIQADKSLMKRLKKAEREMREGKGTPLEKVKEELGLV